MLWTEVSNLTNFGSRIVCMPTYHQRFQESIATWSEEARRLAARGFELRQARNLITQVGAQVEIFMKTVLLPNIPPKQDFDACINALKSEGISKSDRDSLHRLRILYNESKHNSASVPSLLALQEILHAISEVLQKLSLQNIGAINAEAVLRYHQVFWIAAWDNFIGGDTEVHVIAPGRGVWPPDLDLVYVEMSTWDQLKSSLSAIGSLRNGQDCIPDSVLASFSQESDFLQALVFEGGYRDLIAVLGSYERKEDLIPGLRREDDTRSMMQAFTLASMDVAVQSKGLNSVEEVSSAIAKCAVDLYAVPASYNLLTSLSKYFAEMLLRVDEANRKRLSGPIWVGKDEFASEERSAQSKHPFLPVLVTVENTVVFELPDLTPASHTSIF